MTTAEAMAIAVLEGEMSAAHALADHLIGDIHEGGYRLPPVHKITCPLNRVRVAVFVNHNPDFDTMVDHNELDRSINNWLSGFSTGNSQPVLSLQGVDRIEIYELPERI